MDWHSLLGYVYNVFALNVEVRDCNDNSSTKIFLEWLRQSVRMLYVEASASYRTHSLLGLVYRSPVPFYRRNGWGGALIRVRRLDLLKAGTFLPVTSPNFASLATSNSAAAAAAVLPKSLNGFTFFSPSPCVFVSFAGGRP